MTESFDYLFVRLTSRNDFGMFVFLVGIAGLHNFFPALKLLTALIFLIAIIL